MKTKKLSRGTEGDQHEYLEIHNKQFSSVDGKEDKKDCISKKLQIIMEKKRNGKH